MLTTIVDTTGLGSSRVGTVSNEDGEASSLKTMVVGIGGVEIENDSFTSVTVVVPVVRRESGMKFFTIKKGLST